MKTKAQYTPSPWHVERHTKPVWQDSGGPGNVTYAQMVPITLIVHEQLGDPRLRMCVCQLDASTEANANAALISAAPELLEALTESVLWLKTAQGKDDPMGMPWPVIQQAEEALAKARGE